MDALGRVQYQVVSKEDTELQEFTGEINISGGGTRFPVRDIFSLHQKVRLKFFFSFPLEIEVDCLGEITRTRNFHHNKFIALKFIEIEPKAREKIISLCMAIQREDLRTKVRVSDPF